MTDATPWPDHSVVPAVWARFGDIEDERGEGSWLVARDGRRYLDYTSGIGVTNTGHAHPRVVQAIQEQAAKLLHGQQNIVYHEPGLRLYERLSRMLPGGRRIPLRLPGAHRPGHGPDLGQALHPLSQRAGGGLGRLR